MPVLPSSVLRSVAALAALSAIAAPSRAQAPASAPEFAATILMAGFERPLEVRQAGLKRRVDVATGAVVQTFISDRSRGALIVMTAAGRRRLAFVFPLLASETGAPAPLDLSALGPGAALNRIGASTVAGRPCQLWRFQGEGGRGGVVCATPEGIVLQMKPDGRTTPLFQVQRLTYGRQDPRWFAPPPDFQVAVLPGTGAPPRFAPPVQAQPQPAPKATAPVRR
jgi:hypothetical protein